MKRRKTPHDWMEALGMLGELISARGESGKKILFLDECPWMDTPRSSGRSRYRNRLRRCACPICAAGASCPIEIPIRPQNPTPI